MNLLDLASPRGRRRWLAALGLGASLTGAACRPAAELHVPDPSDPRVRTEQLQARLAARPDDLAARRALAVHAWAVLGEPEVARTHLEALVDAGDPLGHAGLLVMAQARLAAPGIEEHASGLLRTFAAIEPARREPWMTAAAEMAARTLVRELGDVPGDRARFLALEAELARKDLPFVVRQPLVSERANLARLDGEPYAPYFASLGCVQGWKVGPVEGALGSYELGHAEAGPFTPDPEPGVVPLSCVTRVWNPTPAAGIRRMRTALTVPGDTLMLDLAADQPIVVRLDGKVVHRTDRTDRFPVRRRRLELPVAPGSHLLEVAAAIPGEHAWVLVRAVDGAGKAIAADPSLLAADGSLSGAAPYDGAPGREPALTGRADDPSLQPFIDWLAVEQALAMGNTDRAEALVPRLARAPRFAEGHLLRARFERADPSRPGTSSAAREQGALEAALAVDPGLDAARLRVLELQMGRGDGSEVVRALAKTPAGVLDGLDGQLFRFAVQSMQGNEHLALAALERAAELHPQGCKVLMAQRAWAREHDDVRREDDLTRQLVACEGSLELRAELAERRARHGEAVTLWTEALERTPDDVQARAALARLAAVAGQREEAEQHLEAVLALNPLRLRERIHLADLAAADGDLERARARLAHALEQTPYSDELRRTAESLGLPDDLLSFRTDGLAALAEYRASGVTYEGVSEVLVLDRSVARVYPGGGQRQIVHLVVELHNKEALDRYGEISIPDGARLLTLRSIKRDGTILEPEVVSGKEGVELRHLEVGDVVEYEFLVESEPASALPGYVDVSTFRFQSLDIPYHRSELLVVFPPDLPLKVDRRNGAPLARQERVEIGGRSLDVWHFRADRVPRLGVEPGHRSLLEEVPNVRVYTELSVEQWLRTVAANVEQAQRTNPELRRFARRLVRGQETPRAQAEALWRWVVENVEEGGDLSTPATATLAARRGNRLVLLRALAESVDLSSELWLARDAFGPQPVPDGHPMVDAYDTPLLAFDVGAEDPLLLHTASAVMPPGYILPGHVRSSAYRVPLDPGEAPGKTQMPARPADLEDRRFWDLDVRVDATGRALVQGTITLQGMEAVMWRQALREIDRDRVREIFTASELAWLRGAALIQLGIEHEKDLKAPLRLAFKAEAEGFAIAQGDGLLLRSMPLPLNRAASFTQLPSRTTGMVIAYSPLLSARIRIHLDGARFTEVPQAIEVSSARGSFARRVEAGADEVTLHFQSRLDPGVVEAGEYAELAGFSRRVEAAGAAPLRARPVGRAARGSVTAGGVASRAGR